jgi:hypothetical protein
MPKIRIYTRDDDARKLIPIIANAAGRTLTQTEQDAIYFAITQEKMIGTWSKYVAYYGMIGGTSASCAINWKNPGTYDITWVNTVSGDFTNNGWTGNGTNSYGDSNINILSNTIANNVSMSFYSRTNSVKITGSVNNGYLDMGCRDNVNSRWFQLTSRFSDAFDVDISRIYDVTGVSINSITSSGLKATSRLNSTDHSIYSNGLLLTNFTGVNSTLAPNFNLFLGVLNNGGSPLVSTYSNRQYSLFTIGQGFTQQEEQRRYQIIQNTQVMLNRAV